MRTDLTDITMVVDRSGSMGGKPLATSALAAAAVASREPNDYSVLAFGRDVVVAKSQDVPRPADDVVNSVLTLRGFGTTDLATALKAACEQLSRSRAARKVVVLLSDCRANEPGDVVAAAQSLDELCIIAPEGDDVEARELAGNVGARIETRDCGVEACGHADRQHDGKPARSHLFSRESPAASDFVYRGRQHRLSARCAAALRLYGRRFSRSLLHAAAEF